jgi:hypothetical protein
MKEDINERELNIFSLPLISKYRVIVFYGTADGSAMNQGFNIADFQGRIIILKSFRMIPYSPDGEGGVVDFYLDDGVNPVSQETIFDGGRLPRFFDFFGTGFSIDLRINNTSTSIFSNVQGGGGFYPGDLWIDNIFYKFPEKVQSLELFIQGLMINDISVNPYGAGEKINPDYKVVIECYLI